MTNPGAVGSLEDRSVALVRQWLEVAARQPVPASSARLATVLEDVGGLAFAVRFVDGVVRPIDRRVAARNLRALAASPPAFLPGWQRSLLRVGGVVGLVAPAVVVPVARRSLREMVGHLVVDASDARLGHAIGRLRRDGVRLNLNLLGEAVLGRAEADRRLAGTLRLLQRPDVDYVSVKVSSTVGPHSPWAFEEATHDVVERLRPLFRVAARRSPPSFVNLDMEEYRDLDLTLAAFTRLLDEPELLHVPAGVALQAYLPDALGAMQHLQAWAQARRARGGAPIKVRLVKGANLPMEHVEAELHGWPVATWPTKQDTDTHYKQVLEWALTPERVANVRVGVAGHNLFDVARAWLLAGDRGVRDAVDVEMLLGMAPAQAEAVLRTVGSVRLYTPVVHPGEFDVAIAYLVRRLEEGASEENFLSAVFDLATDPKAFEREEARFRASAADVATLEARPRRVADRYAAVGRPGPGRFVNTPDTDPSVAEHRAWARSILRRAATSTTGAVAIDAARVADLRGLDGVLARAHDAGRRWGARTGAERGRVLHALGDAIEAARAELVEVMVAEAGKTFDQADPEVSEAVDFAHYYGEQARLLDDVDGAVFEPRALTLVAPPWNFPVAIPGGSALAALGAGSAVVLKPAPPAERCGAVLAGVLRAALAEAGVPPDLLTLVQVDERALGPSLVAHPLVDQVLLTGAFETAELFRSLRPDLRLLAETSGKNAIVVTPSADLDLAVRDVVASAFGHAGQKCSAASLVIPVGSVATTPRFVRQLRDAVASLVVDHPTNPAAQMGPLIEPAGGKLLEGLTELGPGERWILQPRRLDGSGRLWSPGLRTGVRRGSPFHRIEYFGPILGILPAASLDEAIDAVNEVDFGLTSGLHSLDPTEIATWLARVQAGNLYVNRGTTGAIVRRQPFGGWKRSAVGPGAKVGGPNQLVVLGGWRPARAEAGIGPVNRVVRALLARVGPLLSTTEVAALRRSAASDALEWRDRFSAVVDPSDLLAERNLFRYLPVPGPVTVRVAGGAPGDLVRVVVAAATGGVAVRVSVSPAAGIDGRVLDALRSCPAVEEVGVEDDASFAIRARTLVNARIRAIGTSRGALASATGGRPDVAVWDGPVTEAGRIELLPFLREQSVSITAHRFGTPDHLTDGVI